MQSPNAMAASIGHPPMISPPTPDSLVNKSALAGLVFSTEPKKFRTYTRQFKSAVGAQYKYTLERAIALNDLEPTNASAIVMHNAIYDMLILGFKDEDDILDDARWCRSVGRLGLLASSHSRRTTTRPASRRPSRTSARSRASRSSGPTRALRAAPVH